MLPVSGASSKAKKGRSPSDNPFTGISRVNPNSNKPIRLCLDDHGRIFFIKISYCNCLFYVLY